MNAACIDSVLADRHAAQIGDEADRAARADEVCISLHKGFVTALANEGWVPVFVRGQHGAKGHKVMQPATGELLDLLESLRLQEKLTALLGGRITPAEFNEAAAAMYVDHYGDDLANLREMGEVL